MDKGEISNKQWKEMAERAWEARENAYLIGDTKVGCAVLSYTNKIYVGCNVEHRYRCHDVHAEVNAISNMIASGETKLKAIIIVAERNRFTPCGGCMDWIMQHIEKDCLVAYQNNKNGDIIIHTALELMPFYPN